MKLIFVLVLSTFSSTGLGQNLVDLSQWETSQLKHLDAKWQFYFGDFLTADQMDTISDPLYVNVPSTWDEYGKPFPDTGIATYYLKIVLPSSVSNLGMDARITGLNYKLFVNGELTGELGKAGRTKEESIPKYQNIIYKLPEADTLKIIYQVSNFHYRKGGMWRAPIMSSMPTLRAKKEKKLILDFFLMGAILFMGVYHLALNLFKYKDKLAINFALVCFLTVIRSASVGEFALVEYAGWSWFVVTRIEFISFFLLLGFTARFVYFLFPEEIPKIISRIAFTFGLIASVFALFAPLYYSSYLIPVAQGLTVLTGALILFFISKNAIKGGTQLRVALAGFTILFAATVFEILMHHSELRGDVIFATGIFLYLFSHVVIMAYRTNLNYERTEELSLALQQLNTELERKVKERTTQLDDQNDALKKANENLKNINLEKDGILHVVAHDLKSPLNTSIGLSNIVQKSGEVKKEDNLKYLGMIEHVSKQGLKFINDLLVLYQFEDAYKPQPTKIKLKSFAEDLEDKFKQIAKEKKIEFEIDHSFDEDATFFSDENMLHRIIDNLLSNAFKYSFPETQVKLKYELKSKGLFVQVADQGQGIPEKEHHKVFKKFQKISTKPTGKETSSGLGLSIVKQLVTILGGEISFTSEQKKGTTFEFNIPNHQ